MTRELDDVDRGILHVLQQDAREATAAEMGEYVGTAPSTVRNRIDALEEAGVIRGYLPELDYEAAGFDLHLFVVCRAPTGRRTELADRALELPGVISVRELTTGSHNIHIELVATDTDTADEARAGLEDLPDLEIVSTQIINDSHLRPFNHFGKEATEK